MTKVNLEFIKNKRIEKGLSMQYMANKLGFKTAASYLQYENGNYELKADMLPIIVKELGCSIENIYM